MLVKLPYRELLQVLVQNNQALKMTYFTTALNYQQVRSHQDTIGNDKNKHVKQLELHYHLPPCLMKI